MPLVLAANVTAAQKVKITIKESKTIGIREWPARVSENVAGIKYRRKNATKAAVNIE